MKYQDDYEKLIDYIDKNKLKSIDLSNKVIKLTLNNGNIEYITHETFNYTYRVLKLYLRFHLIELIKIIK